METVIGLLAFLIGVLLVYWRENKKTFQEKIFEYKFEAYREILEAIGTYYQDVYNFLERFQNFDGSEKEWELIFLKESGTYTSKAMRLELLFYKYLSTLPQKQLELFREITLLAQGHITNHFHCRSSFPHDSYDRLWDLFIDFSEEARKDLGYDILNSSLNKRLSQQFYPVEIPRKKS
ncbi:hypothetical protein MM239_12360 [Belliella sp. DSM 111904]|uniref:Phage abortive infection protein n=1 Tax=Belliella filtrata TaxID=2923435 RepID=A0ABS9V1A1_9BACT|nr:hypothetical protein [Belliella filtrata]MCH7410192.1 hypothetical protein [Belliella filtrata]